MLFTTLALTALGSVAAASTCAPAYGQCGGQGWTGATCCVSGYHCQFGNTYYSQCVEGAGTDNSQGNTGNAGTAADKAATAQSTTMKAVAAAVSTKAPSKNGVSFTPLSGGRSGTGSTTRYWDCCKPSCAWNGKASVTSPIRSCAADGVTVVDDNIQSGCVGGSSYMCSNQQPWAYNSSLAFGFVAASMVAGTEANMCCSCFLLTFNNGAAAGKQMAVQLTNTGTDLNHNHFDIAMPGGGVGLYDVGCKSQWGALQGGWGKQYGGVDSKAQCDSLLPAQLHSGCDWRWDFLNGGDNPDVSFNEIVCPKELTDISGCIRN